MELANMYVSITSDDAKFSKGIAEAHTRLEGLKNRMEDAEDSSKRFAEGIAVLGAGLLAAGTASFKWASDLSESMNKADVAFKNNADQVQEWSKDTLDSIGVAQGTALDMAAGFGDMATSMGITTDKAADMSTTLVDLGGDMASFKNISVDIANTALTGVFTGETEALKTLGIVMTQANLQEYALAQGIKTKVEEMSQSEQVMLRYNYVLSVTKNAQGDFERTQSGAANQMRIFTEGIKELGAAFGEHLLPAITPAITEVNTVVKGLKDIDEISDSTKSGIAILAGAIVGGLTPALIAGTGAAYAFIAPLAPFMAAGALVSGIAFTADGFEHLSAVMVGLSIALPAAVIGIRSLNSAIIANQAISAYSSSIAAAAVANVSFAESSNFATTATMGLAASQNALKLALISTGIGALVVALGALAYYLMSAENEYEDLIRTQKKATDEFDTLQKSTRAEIKATEGQIDTMREMEAQYVATAQALKDGTLSHDEAAAAQVKMQQMTESLTAAVGQETAAQIQNAADVRAAYSAELSAKEETVRQKNKLLESAKTQDLAYTDQAIRDTMDRITALQTEAEAMTAWHKVLVWFYGTVMKGLADTMSGKFAEVANMDILPDSIQNAAAGAHQAIQGLSDGYANFAEVIKADDASTEIGKLTDELDRLLERKERLGGGGDGAAYTPPDIGSGVKAAAEGTKAAETLKSAWELAADTLENKLAAISNSFGILGNQMEMTGDKTGQVKNQMDELSAKIEVQRQIVDQVAAGYEQMSQQVGKTEAEKQELKEQTEQLNTRLWDEKKALSDLEKQYYDTEQAIKDQAQQMRDLATEIQDVEKKYREDLSDALDDYQRKVADVYADLAQQEADLTAAYEQQVAERAKALANFVGLFDEVTREQVSGDTLLKNLQDQVTAITDWQANLDALQGRGVDSDLLAYLYELGPDAADELAALNTLTDDELSQYVALWQQKNSMATDAARTQLQSAYDELQRSLDEINIAAAEKLEEYRAEWEEKNAEIKKNVEETLSAIEAKMIEVAGNSITHGENIILGLIEGLDNRIPDLIAKCEEIAALIEDTIGDGLEEESPSKVTRRQGQYAVEGLILGIQDRLSGLERVVAGMAALTPAALGASISNISSHTTNNNSGGNTFQIYVQGGTSREQADGLIRELQRRGVRF